MTQPNTPTPPSDERYRRLRRLSRRHALQYLYQADVQHDWGDTETNLRRFHQQACELDGDVPEAEVERSWAFTERLVRGVCEEREALDELIGARATNWTVARMSVIDRNVLRLTAYQLTQCDDVPALAAVDEAIELAKEFGHRHSARFVNGILDRLLHDMEADDGNDRKDDSA